MAYRDIRVGVHSETRDVVRHTTVVLQALHYLIIEIIF